MRVTWNGANTMSTDTKGIPPTCLLLLRRQDKSHIELSLKLWSTNNYFAFICNNLCDNRWTFHLYASLAGNRWTNYFMNNKSSKMTLWAILRIITPKYNFKIFFNCLNIQLYCIVCGTAELNLQWSIKYF